MKKLPPFLPGLSTKLQGSQRRRQLEIFRRERVAALRSSISDLGVLFHDILPAEWLLEISSDVRKRSFTQVTVFWAWISQVLEQNESCSNAVTLIQTWFKDNGLQPPTYDTSSYCKARQRLPDEFLTRVHQKVQSHAETRVEEHHLWYGHRLKAIDGTSVKLMDTPANQKKYPQPSGQAKGCGFPVMGVVGVLDLARGTLTDFITCPYRDHDIKGFYQLGKCFQPGDIAIGDRAFCSYEMLGLLRARGVHSVMRLHQRRDAKRDWKSGKRLRDGSRLVVWKKSAKKGKAGLTDREWEALPDTMELRYVATKAKGRDGKMRIIYLVTTLLEAADYPGEEIALIYCERWTIEVKIRDIKTTMKFEMMRVKSPEMAERTMKLIQIAYNLVKARQAEAIRGELVQLGELGFKGTLDLIDKNRTAFTGLVSHPRRLDRAMGIFEADLRARIIQIRPGRQEPRATKTRPKSYQYLTQPRGEFTEIFHREHYKKAA